MKPHQIIELVALVVLMVWAFVMAITIVNLERELGYAQERLLVCQKLK